MEIAVALIILQSVIISNLYISLKKETARHKETIKKIESDGFEVGREYFLKKHKNYTIYFKKANNGSFDFIVYNLALLSNPLIIQYYNLCYDEVLNKADEFCDNN